MKEILKIMRFDFLNAKPFALKVFIVIVILCFLLSLFISPIIAFYIVLGAMFFVIPLQSMADKNDFNKFYGILPVNRRNITRARFIYIFLVHFVSELIEAIITIISTSLSLYKILPNQNSEIMQMVDNSFYDTKFKFLTIVGAFAFFCLMFSYMEMMGQIFGRENEFKIIILTLGIFTVLFMCFLTLSNRGILPVIKLPTLPSTVSGMFIVGVILNIVMLGICLLFGEITARKLEKREL